MNDHELLELAAKAAGFASIDFLSQDHWANVYEADGRHSAWNPLSDDGDALRLAKKLYISIEFLPDAVRCKAPGIVWTGETCLPCDTEYLGVAHRRAIVRAAAEIERAAQQSKGDSRD